MSEQIDNVVDSIESPATTGQPIPEEVMKADALLAYMKGNSWLTWDPYNVARPDLARKHWIIPVSLTYDIPKGTKRAMYDIEQGGGDVRNIGAFAARCDRSEPFYLYTFASQGDDLLRWAHTFGLRQGVDFYYLAAHANGHKHICAPDVCGFPRADATQYLFAGRYDKSVFWDYALPPVQVVSPYDLFPAFVGDSKLPNNGNERLTVEQTDGALEHPVRYRKYLKGILRFEIKVYRDRTWALAHRSRPPAWNDSRHLGARWQALNRRIEQIDAIH